MRNMLLASIVGLSTLALTAVGCGHASVVKANPAATFPVAATEATPAFLFPINLSHLNVKGGDPVAMGLTVTAGVASHFGARVVSGQQLFDMVGNLSFDLAEQIKAEVDQQTFQMGGPAEATATSLANMMKGISDKLVELKIMSTPFNFKYVIAVHSHGSESMGGKLIAAKSWGGIYDLEGKQIVSYIEEDDKFANDSKAALASLPGIYDHIIDVLLQGTAK